MLLVTVIRLPWSVSSVQPTFYDGVGAGGKTPSPRMAHRKLPSVSPKETAEAEPVSFDTMVRYRSG